VHAGPANTHCKQYTILFVSPSTGIKLKDSSVSRSALLAIALSQPTLRKLLRKKSRHVGMSHLRFSVHVGKRVTHMRKLRRRFTAEASSVLYIFTLTLLLAVPLVVVSPDDAYTFSRLKRK
jgi:hypothetical protein